MLRILTVLFASISLGLVSILAIIAIVVAIASPKLPEVSALINYQPKIPLRVMTADGIQIGEFGKERRRAIKFEQVPRVLIDAILAAEDDRFFQHQGIDLNGILRSVVNNVIKRSKAQGGSTITMQVARNFYLSSEKTFTRKIYEVLLALDIERKLTKKQILELYINKIYLGKRSYGFASASQVYFGKQLRKINVAEAAMLAGLPKAPSKFNPFSNYKRAIIRQRYVLKRMYKLKKITLSQYQEQFNLKLKLNTGKAGFYPKNKFSVSADHITEMVRQQIYSEFKENTYNIGLTVFTTIRAKEQQIANEALNKAIINFTLKNSFKGPEGFIKLPKDKNKISFVINDELSKFYKIKNLPLAVITKIEKNKLTLFSENNKKLTITNLKNLRNFLSSSTPVKKRLRVGSVVRIGKLKENKQFKLTQTPKVEGALIAIQTKNGAIRALVGGFDFNLNKYNRVTQAYRQPGSALKPFIFGAALEKGFSPSTFVSDLPVNFSPESTGGVLWEPKNFNDIYLGPITIKEALTKSQNMVSIRLVKDITPKFAQSYIRRFGFETSRNPPYFTLALGAGAVTPLQLAVGYSMIANGGYYVKPHFIDRIVDANGRLIRKYEPLKSGNENHRVTDSRHTYILNNLLSDVISNGTGRKAKILKRPDIAGKTGTTNNAVDAWFAGYQPTITAISWMGFDSPQSLGKNQTGSAVALPIWIDFMREALKNVPISFPVEPPGIIRINDNLYTEDTLPPRGIQTIDINFLDDEINF